MILMFYLNILKKDPFQSLDKRIMKEESVINKARINIT